MYPLSPTLMPTPAGPSRERQLLARLRTFVRLALAADTGAHPPLSAVLHKLQQALASSEAFPVLLSRVMAGGAGAGAGSSHHHHGAHYRGGLGGGGGGGAGGWGSAGSAAGLGSYQTGATGGLDASRACPPPLSSCRAWCLQLWGKG